MEFPVLEIISELRGALREHPVTILQAPPGAGKSTVLPLEIIEESWLSDLKIIMLEPRRLAARAVAERMASMLGEPCGQRVGYRVRFESKVSAATKIEVVTEGILTRMIQSDSTLGDVGLLIFDEFHERSIHADLALSFALQIQQVLRPDLRILIMSATFDAGEISALLGNAPVITSQGRQYPVDVRYEPIQSDRPVVFAIPQVIRRVLKEESGDILVFLPGAGEIRKVASQLEDENIAAAICPLYGDLNFARQQEALLPRKDGTRKVVLATSIAETSLTIEGVRVVIDSGMARVPRFDPRSGLTRLETIPVTKDAAEQRAGRAGRLAPGVCYRLWSSGAQINLVDKRKPEILEADLAPLMLELAQWGIREANELFWITPPPTGALAQARELLSQLEAIDDSTITDRGKRMNDLPTHPRLAHLLLVAEEDSASAISVALAADVAALLEERDPLDRSAGADLALRVEVLRRWRSGNKVNADSNTLERIEKLAANWRRLFRVNVDNSIPSDSSVGKLLWAAYPERIAQQQGKHSLRYKLWNGRMASLPPGDPLTRETWICIAHLDAGTNEGRAFLAAPVHPDDLRDHAEGKTTVLWDDERGMVAAYQELRLGPLILESKPIHKIPDESRIATLAGLVRSKGLRILGDPDSWREMQNRIISLSFWRTDEPWPRITDEYLIDSIGNWLAPFLSDVSKRSELGKLDMSMILRSILPWELEQKLDSYAPARLEVPTGSRIQVRYDEHGSPPVMEVRLQEMFGLAETPTVNEGRTKVLLHLLSPGFKPVQVTQDLRSFWQTTYHEVRKELRMRYPKHHWPEDPWNAQPIRGPKRRNA